MNQTLKLSCILLIYVLHTSPLTAQSAGDYRSKKSGSWTDTTVWETFNGSSWINAHKYPTYANGTITIQNNSLITIESVSLELDQLIINSGSLHINAGGNLNLRNGKGEDLTCAAGLLIDGGKLNFELNSSLSNNTFGNVLFNSGTISGSGQFNNNSEFQINSSLLFPDSVIFNLNSGIINGSGNLKIFGIINHTSGDIHVPLTIASSATYNISISANANISSLTNNGIINWYSGDIFFTSNVIFNNNNTFNIYTNGFLENVDSPAVLNNAKTGIIKIFGSGGSTIFLNLNNSGVIQINSGSFVTAANCDDNNTINIAKNAYYYNEGTVILNSSSALTGSGNFFNKQKVIINSNYTLPENIYFIDQGFLTGKGQLYINGRMQLSDENGSCEIPLIINSTGICEFIRAQVSKPVINYGEADFEANFLFVESTTFTNNNLVKVNAGNNFVLNSHNKHKSMFINNGLINQTGSYPSEILSVLFPFKNTTLGTIGGTGGFQIKDTLINEGSISPGLIAIGEMDFYYNPFRTTSTTNIDFEKEGNKKSKTDKIYGNYI